MPMPKVRKGETTKDFISRCLSDDVMKKEYPNNKHRLGVCYSLARKTRDVPVVKKTSEGKMKLLMKTRSLIGSPGGKILLKDRIIRLFPPHRCYVEPFFGGGQVFFGKKP